MKTHKLDAQANDPLLTPEDTLRDIGAKLDLLLNNQISGTSKTWFTREEAAQYLSCSAKTIDRNRLKKNLPFYCMEGTSNIRFKRKDLDALMS